MNRNIRTAMAVILLATASPGCHSDPESGRLATGTEVMLYDEDFGAIPVEVPGEMSSVVPVGTKVAVLADDEPDPKDEKMLKLRKVRISVKEGKFVGTVGTVSRRYLRPVAR